MSDSVSLHNNKYYFYNVYTLDHTLKKSAIGETVESDPSKEARDAKEMTSSSSELKLQQAATGKHSVNNIP